MTKYDLEYKGVKCTGADWEADPNKFSLIYKGRQYLYEQKRFISQSADTDHIRCVINQFLEDDVVGDVQKSLHDWVKEAYKQAIKEGIDANTVVLNKNFIKTNGFAFCISNHFWHDLPPMICGLEIRVADELPEKVDFALIINAIYGWYNWSKLNKIQTEGE